MAAKWTTDANAALCLRLAGAPAPQDAVFHPEFTYPIFGDAETIFGYTGLRIHLSMASGSLTPSLAVEYAEKNTKTTAKIDDVDARMREFLPTDQLVSPEELERTAESEARGGAGAAEPLGERVHSYSRSDSKKKRKWSLFSFGSARDKQDADAEEEFVIFHATWDTPGFREWQRRVRILTLLYIEGASYLDEDETNWEFYLLYRRVKGADGDAWHFVGYTSLYRFWCWPDQVRLRLSQFLILPPYQGQGHGSRLYATVVSRMLADEQVCELAVEDPSEAFDHLRDAGDLRRLSSTFGAEARRSGHLRAPVDREWSEAQRRANKLAPRQWARLLEMLQLLALEDADEEQLRAYRLQVKARLYRKNREVLQQVPKAQRLDKLQETFESVVDEYSELTGAEVPEALLEAPEHDEAPLDIPPALGRAARAFVSHGDEEGPRKAQRLG